MADKLIQIRSNLEAVRDHTQYFSDFTFVYPVISRRSGGLSIGINLNLDKICNFNCLYCEVDRSTPGRVSALDLNQLRDELIAMVRFAQDGGLAKEPKFDQVPWLTRSIQNFAFSGDGEPTLIENFAECVQVVAEVRQTEELSSKIILITDAAGLDKPDVKAGLRIMDANNGEVWAKLDAGTDAYFQKINRTSIRFERILNNITTTAQERPIVIQSLFGRVDGALMSDSELGAYCSRLNDIIAEGGQIREVHVYTLARPAANASFSEAHPGDLRRVAAVIRAETGLDVAVFG